MAGIQVDERIAQRRAQVRDERRRRRLRRTVAVAVILVLIAVAYGIERSSLVALAEVRVEGTERLTVSEVVAAADLELGTSTLRLGLGAAEERVEALPLVADAHLRRLDPLTVLVTVTERRPMAVVAGRGGPVLVDEQGVVIARGHESGLPQIAVPGGAVPVPGADVGATPAVATAHAVLRDLPGPLRTEIERYVAVAEDELELELRSGVRVAFGRAERIAEKARALAAVLEDLDGRAVSTIDVRAPTAPVVVP